MTQLTDTNKRGVLVHKIRPKIMILSMLIMFGVFSTVISTSYVVYRKSVMNIVEDSLQKSASESAWHLSNFINGYLAPLEELSREEVFQTRTWEQQKKVIELQANPNYENIAVVDLKGFATYLDGTILDLSDRPYIQQALLGHRAISDIITSRKTMGKVVVSAVPIMKQNQVVGALMARLDMNLLQQYISARVMKDYEKVLIVSKTGSIIMNSPKDEILYQNNIFEIGKNYADYAELSEMVQESTTKSEGIDMFKMGGEVYFVYFSSIDGTSWKTYILANRTILMDDINQIIVFLSIGAIFVFILATYFAWRIIERFTEPILELERLMDQGTKGDFNVFFQTNGDDEIARLGTSFNRLVTRIKELTYYDPVTEHLNRNVLKNELNLLVHGKEKQIFAIVMIQVDDYHRIIEDFGQDEVDTLLIEMCERMVHEIGDISTLYRYKEDTFALISMLNAYENQSILLKRTMELLKALCEPYTIKNECLDIKFDIGVHFSNTVSYGIDPLEATSIACKYARSQDVNHVQVFRQEMVSLVSEEKRLVEDIRIAVNESQFFLMLQPIFRLSNEQVVKYEALIRWIHPQKGLVSPDLFIEVAEKNDLIDEIDWWVIEEVCRTLKKWHQLELKVAPISINLTSKTFELKDFIHRLESVLKAHEIPPQWIEFEITERMVIRKIDESISKLNLLRGMGIKVSIDDFGIGYSSLSYLIKLPIDYVKIDKSFIEQLLGSDQTKILVKTIVNLCKNLELEAVAEGIETVEEWTYLQQIQCELGQGYYLSKPTSVEIVEYTLQSKTISC